MQGAVPFISLHGSTERSREEFEFWKNDPTAKKKKEKKPLEEKRASIA